MSAKKSATLPCVQWGKYRISRLCVGHNPLKGQSHLNRTLDEEMAQWYDPQHGRDLELLRLCENAGINTVQFGGDKMHALLHRYKEQGGRLQWISTLYDPDNGDFDAELKRIIAVDPKPIGIQYYAGTGDREYLLGRMNGVRDKVKKIRDSGVLTGVGTHLPEVVDFIENQHWDVDFYQTCFYTVYVKKSLGVIDRDNETFENDDRTRMAKVVKQASKPCIAFKVLGATRNCAADKDVEAAFKFAYDNIKESDVVLVGMWQKYKDQVSQNAKIVRRLLSK